MSTAEVHTQNIFFKFCFKFFKLFKHNFKIPIFSILIILNIVKYNKKKIDNTNRTIFYCFFLKFGG
jgi:hypothetical protein